MDALERGTLLTIELVTVVGVDDETAIVVDDRRVVRVGQCLGSAGKEVGGVALVQGWSSRCSSSSSMVDEAFDDATDGGAP